MILTPLQNCFPGRFLGKLAENWLLKLPPLFAHVATLTCENINVRKQAINDNLQGSIATYLRYDGVYNNQIKKGLLLSLSLKKIWKSSNIW